ncbi:MAG: hypothetical protein JXA57_16760 [Armatimonadetes bacterium]|nr:hypothetical protein [Armatimonadota bacterium]
MAKSDTGPVRLLWTGGWDSTFQLLRLLDLAEIQIEPIYVIDEERRSVGVEILTMKRIKGRLFDRYPRSRELLLPTRYFAVADIPPCKEITSAYLRLRQTYMLGIQYDWMARFCEAQGLHGTQMCVNQPGRAYDCLLPVLEENGGGPDKGFQVSDRFRSADQYRVFQYYAFPLFEFGKLEAAAIARGKGWDAIMDMTWFCHHPRKGMKPCGTCNPCLDVIDSGLGWRLPASSRARSRLYHGLYRPAKNLAKKMARRPEL